MAKKSISAASPPLPPPPSTAMDPNFKFQQAPPPPPEFTDYGDQALQEEDPYAATGPNLTHNQFEPPNYIEKGMYSVFVIFERVVWA